MLVFCVRNCVESVLRIGNCNGEVGKRNSFLDRMLLSGKTEIEISP